MTMIDNGMYKLIIADVGRTINVGVDGGGGGHTICLTVEQARTAIEAIESAIKEVRTRQHDAETAAIFD